MAIDLGDTPVGTPPTPEQQEQIRASIGIASTDSMTFSALTLAGQSVGGEAATNLVNLTTTWNTTGNPSMIYGRVTNTNSGATSNLLDLGTVAAGSLFKIDKTGEVNATGTVISTNDFKVGAARHFHHINRAAIGSPATGIHTLSNAALDDYDRLQFGGTTSLFPAIKRNTTGLDIKLADNSDFTKLTAKTISATGNVTGNLPAFGNGSFGIEFFTSASRLMIREGSNTVAAFGSPASGIGLIMTGTKAIGWSNVTPDGTYALTLFRDADGILAQRNAGNTQVFRLYHGTDSTTGGVNPTTFDRATFSFTSGNFRIAAENSGAGLYATARGIDFAVSNVVRLKILPNGTTNFINEAYFLSSLYSFDGTNSYLGLSTSGSINKLFTTSGSTNKNITISPADVAMMTLTQTGVGIGTATPTSKLQVTAGDIELETVGNGIIMKAAGTSTRYRITLNAGGTALVFTAI